MEESGAAVVKLRYGCTNTFLIRGTGGALLLDTDFAGTLPAFYRALKECGGKMGEISYVLATHYHPDHIGLVSELMKRGVRLLVMEAQLPYIHFADGIFGRDWRLGYEPIREEDAVVIRCGESRGFLAKLGIAGEILSVPSHSADSVALILDGGSCFVGDLEPAEYADGYEDAAALRRDWALIARRRPERIYYAHANEKILR